MTDPSGHTEKPPQHSAPTHDDQAEQALLGAMLISPAAVAQALTLITPDQLYRPHHQLIWHTITGAPEWGDPTIIASTLLQTGQISRLPGGANYLHDCIRTCPNPANITYYAQAITTTHTTRQRRELLTRLNQALDQPDPNAWDTAWTHAQTHQQPPQVAANGHNPIRLTPASAFTIRPVRWLWDGRMPMGEITLIPGREGVGKALAVDTPMLTDRGWTSMGEIKPGDRVRHPSGDWTTVIAATLTMHDRPCYRVSFDDGFALTADADHLWRVETLNREAISAAVRGNPPKSRSIRYKNRITVTTAEIATTLHARSGHCLNYAIATTSALASPDQLFSIDPYVLGAWLGDGDTRHGAITCFDEEILVQIRAAGEPISSRSQPGHYGMSTGRGGPRAGTVQARLRQLGVLNDKHIPESYLRGSVTQRLALLQGLMDTDGTIATNGRCELSVCHEHLARTTYELLLTLGIKVSYRHSPATLNGRVVGTRWRMSFRTDLPVFRLPRKAARLRPTTTRRHQLRYITAVIPTDSVPVRCIQVAHPDGMFLAGKGLVPTHNSVLMAWLAAAVTNGNLPGRHHGTPRAVLYAATEDSWDHGIAPRLLAAGARLDQVYRVDVADPDTDGHRGLILPRDTPHLPARAREVEAALLICDPIISMVDEKINSFKAQELRKALEPLKAAIEAAGVAAACLVHFNKTAGDIMTMISGSRAWGEVARATIAVARDDAADETTNIVSQVKNNLGRLDLPNLTYTIDDVTIETSFGEDAHPGRLRWTGETDTTAADLLGGHAGDRTYSDTTLAILAFVKDMAVTVSVGDVAEHFKDSMRYDAVKRTLARCAKRGDLVSPQRGYYELPPKGTHRPR